MWSTSDWMCRLLGSLTQAGAFCWHIVDPESHGTSLGANKILMCWRSRTTLCNHRIKRGIPGSRGGVASGVTYFMFTGIPRLTRSSSSNAKVAAYGYVTNRRSPKGASERGSTRDLIDRSSRSNHLAQTLDGQVPRGVEDKHDLCNRQA